MTNLKELFKDEYDFAAEKMGEQIAEELDLKPLPGYDNPMYQTSSGKFSNIGLARRVARIFLETKVFPVEVLKNN